MKTSPRIDFKDALRGANSKVTPGRIAILNVLKKSTSPVSVQQISEKLPVKLNQTTIYRAIEALSLSGIIRKIDLGETGSRYELSMGTTHHHHIICKKCGKIEDIKNCDSDELEKLVLKKSVSFSSIQDHSLEFFGVCKKCA
ncbi:MAG: transcriptional repressor [Patescibacteria group bacterium]